MVELGDVAQVLGLFDGTGVNPDFVRQLASFTVLRELLCLPLRDEDAADAADAEGADRTHLLSLWVGPAAGHWTWAVETLLDAIDQASERAEAMRSRQPELDKLRQENLEPPFGARRVRSLDSERHLAPSTDEHAAVRRGPAQDLHLRLHGRRGRVPVQQRASRR